MTSTTVRVMRICGSVAIGNNCDSGKVLGSGSVQRDLLTKTPQGVRVTETRHFGSFDKHHKPLLPKNLINTIDCGAIDTRRRSFILRLSNYLECVI